MSTSYVDRLLESVFLETEVEDMPEPTPHPRFKWTPAAPVQPIQPSGDPDDRVGKHSMSDLLPKKEVATTDDLIDFFSRTQKQRGKPRKSMEKEFAAHRTEFESQAKLAQFVDAVLS